MTTLIMLAALTLGQQPQIGATYVRDGAGNLYMQATTYDPNTQRYTFWLYAVPPPRPAPTIDLNQFFEFALQPRRESYRARRGRYFFWQ